MSTTWLPPVDCLLDERWRVTLLRQDHGSGPVTVGVVLLSCEPGDDTAGVPVSDDVWTAAGRLVAAEAGRLGRVADIYRQAVADGQRPVQAVAEAFGLADGSAGNLVMRARQARLLPATSPGRAAA